MSLQSRLAALITEVGTDFKNIQTSLASKVPITRSVAGKTLDADITLNATDVGAVTNSAGTPIRIHKIQPASPIAGEDYWIDDSV